VAFTQSIQESSADVDPAANHLKAGCKVAKQGEHGGGLPRTAFAGNSQDFTRSRNEVDACNDSASRGKRDLQALDDDGQRLGWVDSLAHSDSSRRASESATIFTEMARMAMSTAGTMTPSGCW